MKLGSKRIEQIIEIKLTPEEKAGLDKSANAVKELRGDRGVGAINAQNRGGHYFQSVAHQPAKSDTGCR